MRLFIAINLDESTRIELTGIISRLQKEARQGSYTLPDNLHLTLIFLGEIEPREVDKIKQVMQGIQALPFEIQFSGWGSFKRREGDIHWIGIKGNDIIDDIHEQLFSELSRAGFKLEKRSFKPHLTIGRQIVTGSNFDPILFRQSIPDIKMITDRISLMKSERINGRLTYTEVYGKMLT